MTDGVLQCGHVDDILGYRRMWLDRQGHSLCTRCFTRLAGDETYKRIALDIIGIGSDREVRISTVWLGIDHNWSGSGPPIIFETMVFTTKDSELDETMERYATEDAARAGHAEMVTLVRTALSTSAGSMIQLPGGGL